MQKNDLIQLNITDMSAEGAGVGRYDGLAVFVPMSAPGDLLTVRVLKVKSSYAYGKIEQILSPSDLRCENDCAAFSKCGGCVYRHLTYDAETAIKQNRVEQALRRIGGIDLSSQPIVRAKNGCRTRNKAQYPIDPSGRVGFFAPHSHRVVPCDDCALQPEEFSRIAACFENWLKETGQTIYNEETGKGLLRHLYIRKATVTGEIMVCVVAGGHRLPQADRLVEELKTCLGDDLKTVVLNINTKKTNVILSDSCVNLYGDGYIYDVLCGVKVRLSPLSFYQVNHDMAEKLYEKAAEYAKPQGKTVLDLYCGAGTIGLSMARSAKSVIGVEIVPQAVEDAKYNAALNGIDNARFLCADAAAAAKQLQKEGIRPDVVLVDPPRKGCSPELLDTIANGFAPEKLVYVSCDPGTLARDLKILADLGYHVLEYTPFDLFPRTSHVETVALLSRSDINS